MQFRLYFLLLFVSLMKKCNLHPNLHSDHLLFYFKMFPQELKNCNEDVQCPKKATVEKTERCWGYEDNCSMNNSFAQPVCNGDHKGWVRSDQEQLDTFYNQADFGYVRSHKNSIQIVCEPTFKEDAALECSDYLQFCRGRNLFLNLTTLDDLGSWRYRMDVLKPGDLGGWCLLHRERIDSRLDHMSPLQSWAPEMRNFMVLPDRLNITRDCDVYMEKPTFIMKIDATVNMYHHLCDFLNLYASLHVNTTHPSAFSTDVQIIVWETYPYYSAFRDMWSAFTDHPILTLNDLRGKTVCFRNVVFPLLPRMIFGLYYNTPLVYGCEGSGLFKAFSQHILHRLQIPPPPSRNNSNVRVTLLSRETSHRNIVNEGELMAALTSEPGVDAQRVVFSHKTPFREQLTVIQATDLFIGVHGAGLTHLLFLPDWAAVFELYNCEDESCYLDLARLRGVRYSTWSKKDKVKSHGDYKHPEGGAHAKFTNYSFDVEEFMKIVRSLLDQIRSHSEFVSKVPEDLTVKDELRRTRIWSQNVNPAEED